MKRQASESASAMESIHTYLNMLRAERPSKKLALGRSNKGAKTINLILATSYKIFSEDGYSSLTFRKVSRESGLAVGNVNYYFSTKHDLVVATLQEALADYIEAHLQQLQNSGDTPLDVLLNVVSFYVRSSAETHPLFFQMWGYASTSPEAKQVIREIYRPIGRFIYFLVRACNPSMDHFEARKAVFQIFSLEQGMKLFIGIGPEDDIALPLAEEILRETTRNLVTTP